MARLSPSSSWCSPAPASQRSKPRALLYFSLQEQEPRQKEDSPRPHAIPVTLPLERAREVPILRKATKVGGKATLPESPRFCHMDGEQCCQQCLLSVLAPLSELLEERE